MELSPPQCYSLRMRLSRDIKTKDDAFYELRPTIYLIFGVIGIFGSAFNQDVLLTRIGQVSGIMLIFAAWKVYTWRKANRKTHF